jgi:hypothetical protein
MINIPAPQVSEEGRKADAGLIKELRFGIGYIWKRPGLRGLLRNIFLHQPVCHHNLFCGAAPMILARSGGDEVALGITQTVMGWACDWRFFDRLVGTPRRKSAHICNEHRNFLFVCDLLTAVGRVLWSGLLRVPFGSCPYRTLSAILCIWQERVPQDVQGRVFSTREMLQIMAQPAGFLLGGLLADNLFEPAMQNGGLLQAGSEICWEPGRCGHGINVLMYKRVGWAYRIAGLGFADVRAIDYEHETCNDKVTAPVAP